MASDRAGHAGARLRARRRHPRGTTRTRPGRSAAACARARRRCSTPRCGPASRWAPARTTSTTSTAIRSASTPRSRSWRRRRQTMSFTQRHGAPDRHPRLHDTRAGGRGYVTLRDLGHPGRAEGELEQAVGLERAQGRHPDRHVSTLRHGVREQTEYPANGMDVSVTRIVRKNGTRHPQRDRTGRTTCSGTASSRSAARRSCTASGRPSPPNPRPGSPPSTTSDDRSSRRSMRGSAPRLLACGATWTTVS